MVPHGLTCLVQPLWLSLWEHMFVLQRGEKQQENWKRIPVRKEARGGEEAQRFPDMQGRALSPLGPGGKIAPLTCMVPPCMLWWDGHRHPPPHATAQGHRNRVLEQRQTSAQQENRHKVHSSKLTPPSSSPPANSSHPRLG